MIRSVCKKHLKPTQPKTWIRIERVYFMLSIKFLHFSSVCLIIYFTLLPPRLPFEGYFMRDKDSL